PVPRPAGAVRLTGRSAGRRPRPGAMAFAVCALVLAACAEESSRLRVVPLEPAASNVVAGSGQVGTVGQRVPDSLAVRVTDRFGNPVPQAEVVFAVADGGGAVQPATARTGLDGIARTAWPLGTTAGLRTLRAELPGIEPALFTRTAN